MSDKILMRYSDKAAVLLLAIGMDKAAFVLKQMNPREVQAVCASMENDSSPAPKNAEMCRSSFSWNRGTFWTFAT